MRGQYTDARGKAKSYRVPKKLPDRDTTAEIRAEWKNAVEKIDNPEKTLQLTSIHDANVAQLVRAQDS